MTLGENQTNFEVGDFKRFRRHQKTRNHPKMPYISRKLSVGTALPKTTRLRLSVFSDNNSCLIMNDGLDKAFLLRKDLTKLVITIKEIFDIATREKDHRYLDVGYQTVMTSAQREFFRMGVQKINVDKREDRRRVKVTPKNKMNIYLETIVHRRLKGYKTRYNLESIGHTVNTLLDTICDLRELILVLKEVFKTAQDKEDFQEIRYAFNELMTSDHIILFNQILRDESNGKSG